MEKDLVWYVCYGSNMLCERFMKYIEGGSFREGGKVHSPCRDTAPPLEVRPYDIPYDMYFAMNASSWDYGGVSFLDSSKEGHAIGVAYLVTREQYEHVSLEENGGIEPGGEYGWYNKRLVLGEMDGYEVMSFTNSNVLQQNEPSEVYLNTLKRGIADNYPDMSQEEITAYLTSCVNRKNI